MSQDSFRIYKCRFQGRKISGGIVIRLCKRMNIGQALSCTEVESQYFQDVQPFWHECEPGDYFISYYDKPSVRGYYYRMPIVLGIIALTVSRFRQGVIITREGFLLSRYTPQRILCSKLPREPEVIKDKKRMPLPAGLYTSVRF